ncbi:MAG: ECF-type sigma factor, partial [Usitatibacteraceae bacterium]
MDDLFQLMYPELRRIAHARLRRGFADPDVGTTALVNECYLKFRDAKRLEATDRAHFFAYTSSAMRSIIVDMARSRATERHGGKSRHDTFDEELVSIDTAGEQSILRVHEALEQIGEIDARLVQLVEMRYFAGMTETEIGEAMNISDRTVRREWQKARLLLATALR